MNSFDTLIQKILQESSKYDEKFILGPSEISEIVTDADAKNVLTDEERDAIETELNELYDKIYKKYKGDIKGGAAFWKDAGRIGKEYGIVIKK